MTQASVQLGNADKRSQQWKNKRGDPTEGTPDRAQLLCVARWLYAAEAASRRATVLPTKKNTPTASPAAAAEQAAVQGPQRQAACHDKGGRQQERWCCTHCRSRRLLRCNHSAAINAACILSKPMQCSDAWL